MADALVSTPVAVVAGVAAVVLIAVSAGRVKQSRRKSLTAMMGVFGAFVFAAQMINFTIPGTGSSGHIIGGVLLAALLGPWAGFLTLTSVLIVQCLVFADGGLMALGCNIVNMAAMTCLVAYPLLYRPIAGVSLKPGRLMAASIVACTVALELGAFLVSVETVASGITELPMAQFLWFMLPIHFVIGICEGVATGLVLIFVAHADPQLLSAGGDEVVDNRKVKQGKRTMVLVIVGAVALAFAVAFTWIASSNPDGLEWSIMHMTGSTELAPSAAPSTAFLPDYESRLSGIIGGVIVMAMLWAVCAVIFRPARVRHTKA